MKLKNYLFAILATVFMLGFTSCNLNDEPKCSDEPDNIDYLVHKVKLNYNKDTYIYQDNKQAYVVKISSGGMITFDNCEVIKAGTVTYADESRIEVNATRTPVRTYMLEYGKLTEKDGFLFRAERIKHDCNFPQHKKEYQDVYFYVFFSDYTNGMFNTPEYINFQRVKLKL